MSMSPDCDSFPRLESPRVFNLDLPPIITQRSIVPAPHIKTEKMSRRSFSYKCRVPDGVKLFTTAELQSATNGYSEVNLLGEGSLGSFFKAEFPDGQIVAVKIINTVALSIQEEDQFLDVIRNASRLKHPNNAALLGYCTEHGKHLLVHEYVSHLSLEDALHFQAHKPISWRHRLWISLGIARALEYLVSVCDLNYVAKHLESGDTMFSFIWWIVGFYMVSAGGQSLAGDSRQLYWLCIIFLAFDVFFVVFCVAVARRHQSFKKPIKPKQMLDGLST